MKKESQKLIEKFKILIICIAVFALGMILDTFVLNTGVLNQICGLGIVVVIALIIFTMMKTNTAARDETVAAIKAADRIFQTKYGGAVYCRKGQISEMEKNTNPLFINHTVYTKVEAGGKLKGYYFIYRAVNIEDRELKVQDHNRHKVYVRFQGGVLQWNEGQLAPDTDVIVCSKGFRALTKLKFEKSGYRLGGELGNGTEVFLKTIMPGSTAGLLKYYYDKVENILKNPINAYEMCLRVQGTTIEAYLFERENFPEEYIEQRVQLIECFFEALGVGD